MQRSETEPATQVTTMTEYTTPFQAVFEMQRQTIEQTGKLAETAVTVPKELGEQFGMSGKSAREARSEALDSTRESLHRTLDIIESASGEAANVEELRDSVDRTFDAVDEQQAEACTSFDNEYDRFESDIHENVQTQVDFLLEVNDEMGAQFVEFLDEFGDEVESMTAETVDTAEDVVQTDVSGGVSDEATEETTAGEIPDDVPEDKVACRVCGDVYNAITHPHLQTHDMTIAEYREEFGEDVPLRPDE